MPVVFYTPFKELEYVLNLGYDINCEKKDYNVDEWYGRGVFYGITHNIIMHQISTCFEMEKIKKLISLGANINYQSPDNGASALSIAISKVPNYEYSEFHKYVDVDNQKMKLDPKEFEKRIKEAVLAIIDLSNEDIIRSTIVSDTVCKHIKPGFQQIIFNELLDALSKKEFTVSDDYFANSVKFITEGFEARLVVDKFRYLSNLYSNFANKVPGINCSINNIEKTRETMNDAELFKLVVTNIDRTFITSVDQLEEPEKIAGHVFCSCKGKYEEVTKLMMAGKVLLSEVLSYVGVLSADQILSILDNYPIIDIKRIDDVNSLKKYNILTVAMDNKDRKLCEGLVKRGSSIVCYDENGHDITLDIFDKKYVDMYKKLNKNYNPDQELDDLLSTIGSNKVLIKEKTIK